MIFDFLDDLVETGDDAYVSYVHELEEVGTLSTDPLFGGKHFAQPEDSASDGAAEAAAGSPVTDVPTDDGGGLLDTLLDALDDFFDFF
jgi:hypothetical protein